jgi:plasmid stabilization system protein ParE
MNRYSYGDEVLCDLEQIWDYIARDNPEAADRWIERLLNAFDFLAAHPGAGHSRRDLVRLDVLFWPVEEYLLIYRQSTIGIEVLAVTQGSRDIPLLLQHRKARR